jgi:hypothetical protein
MILGLLMLFGYCFLILGLILGVVSVQAWLILLVAAMGLGVLLSVSALLLEEMSFHVYPAQRDVLKLLLAAVLENFGFRQLNSLWKLIGLYRWVRGKKATWGTMTRTASWQTR